MEGVGIGRIVHYVLTEQDAKDVNRRRTTTASIADRSRQLSDKWSVGAQAHIGNVAIAGQHYPMMVVVVFSDAVVNGQVLLDGNDSLWMTSVGFAMAGGKGTWHWPEPRINVVAEVDRIDTGSTARSA